MRKVDPWSVLKFALVFYFAMTLIFLFAAALIFAALTAVGFIDNLESLARELIFDDDFVIQGSVVFRWLFLIGLGWTVAASLLTVFMAFIYNLIADVVGGIELLVTERE